ncbi:hypothetical protein CANCADRAFT_86604 [Tortispora caseinolytica NRRL Y-17796]|uniref:Uncharacterized protein n=1 Tax=Tortispora caseinolytica NRRL Y-17796 TaxID=767744 RepID=A0A1E4TKW5_9ASCO|nr:hypothetical protein CANCADRAFT_86604 [Tortispora caseinolytica NRRL Y-17796]
MPSDKRKLELAVPYVPAKLKESQGLGMVNTSMPMMATFMRSKILAWSSVFNAMQAYMTDTDDKVEEGLSTLFKLGMAGASIVVTYTDLLFPSKPNAPTKIDTVASTVSSVISAATAA